MRPRQLLSCITFLLAITAPVWGGTPPPGFTETVLIPAGGASGVASPTAVAYEPGNNHLWAVEKGGEIRRRDAGTGVVSTALSLSCVNSSGERGGLGIAFPPNYLDSPSTRYVYIYYTRNVDPSGACFLAGQATGVRNQVSRFLESNGTLAGEETILVGPILTSATNHNAGTIRFASDGTLYVAMGDNNTDHLSNPASRDLTDMRGKLLRVNGDGSIPADNPFVADANVLDEIWAWGLRNPFRFSIDPSDDTPFIADVGEGTWEAIYAGVAGADYGYPCVEGTASFRTCTPSPAAGTVTDPVFVYGHASQTLPVSGHSITGGPVYRATAFPVEFQGDYFFGDYRDGWIRSARVTSGPGLDDVQLFMPDATRVVDMVVSPAGCLTWVSYTDGIRDVCYPGGNLDVDNDGFTPNEGDCDDAAGNVFPGAPELCDALDNNCSGGVDDAVCADFDVDANTYVNGVELAWIGRSFTSCSADPAAEWWFPVDLDQSGCIDGEDLAILATAFACSGVELICE